MTQNNIYYCKFTNREEFESVASSLYREIDDGDGNIYSEYGNGNDPHVDIIGEIYMPSGNKIIQDGVEVNELLPVEGYHVNIRSSEELSFLDAYRIYPATPVRIFG